ncbi:MAG: hypothetical protein RLZZ393_548 [Pseudomonadota bacterium]|jgi:type IV fimbrial biogenesis protein FimT
MRNRGFTAIELLVTIAIVATLLAVAVPAFSHFLVNARIRTFGESMTNALAAARAEAVRLNTRVVFTLDANNWRVNRVDNGEQLVSGTGRESLSAGLRLEIQPTGATTAMYDSLGRKSGIDADGSEGISRIDILPIASAAAGTYRPLRVQLLDSGLSRLCDPSSPSTSATACL